MELKSTFNYAAGGPEIDGVASESPSPRNPSPTGATAQAQPSSETTEPATESTALDVARAEIETLEAGRPNPAPRHKLNPPTHLMKASDAQAEAQREARIQALKAYVQSHQAEPVQEAEHDQGEELEFYL